MEDSLQHKLKQELLGDDWVIAVSKIVEKEDYEDLYLKYVSLFKDPVKEVVVVPN